MKILLNNKGMALIITLILSLVSLGLLAALFFMISSGTNISGSNLRYSSALEAAKGVSEYVMDRLEEMDYNTISDNSSFPLNHSIENMGNFNMTAKILSKKELPGDVYIYSVQVDATKPNTNEKATIQFVYRVE
jgi:flagellar basal body-associated protein FliL